MNKVREKKLGVPKSTPIPDVYVVNGVRYFREDGAPNKMESIMERIAIAQEATVLFYQRWEKKMDPMFKAIEKLMKSKDAGF